jgi:hypothetical protein
MAPSHHPPPGAAGASRWGEIDDRLTLVVCMSIADSSPQDAASSSPPPSPAANGKPLKIVCPPQVISGKPFECTVTVAASDSALRVVVPPGLFHLSNSADARFDADKRELGLPLAGASQDGAPRSFTISLLADQAGAGRTRVLSASMPLEATSSSSTASDSATASSASAGSSAAPEAVESPKSAASSSPAPAPVEAAAGAVERSREETARLETPTNAAPATDSGLTSASASSSTSTPPRIEASEIIAVEPGEPMVSSPFESPQTPATVTVMIAMTLVAVLWFFGQRRRARRAAMGLSVSSSSSSMSAPPLDQALVVTMIGVVLGMFLLFVTTPSVIETVRARTVFVETMCTIVDRGSSGFAPEMTYVPMAVMRYEVEGEGKPRISSGFDIRGTMYGSTDPEPWRPFAAGGRYPCWYDPAQPNRVILRQGPSATAWFALLPITILAISLGALLGVFRD